MTKICRWSISITLSLVALSVAVTAQTKPQGQKEKASDSSEQQAAEKRAAEKNELNLRKETFVNDLKILNQEARNLNNSTAVATVKVGIANVSWGIDKNWSQNLLLEAFELILPDNKEREKIKQQSYESGMVEHTEEGRVQRYIRIRILSIAQRDKAFGELMREKMERELGKIEANSSKVNDTFDLIKNGKAQQATKALLEISAADPTTVRIGYLIREMAGIDRAEADKVILEYLRVLGNQPLTLPTLKMLIQDIGFAVFPFPSYDWRKRKIPVAGELTIRAYLAFSLNSIYQIENNTPGIAMPYRQTILSLGLRLQQYAPDLIPTFMTLEQVTRKSNEPAFQLPSVTNAQANKDRYESLLQETYRSNRQEDVQQAFQMALGREEYDEAEKLLELIKDPDERQKHQEDFSVRKFHYYLNKGELLDAERAVLSLKKSASIVRTFPAIIKYCVSKKDNDRASSLARFAIEAINRSNDGYKARFLTTLASSIAPVDSALSMKVLEGAIIASNQNKRDANRAFVVGIDTSIFSALTPKHEDILRQMVPQIEDPLDRMMSLVAIYNKKVNELFPEKPADSNAAGERDANKQQ